MLFNIWSQIIFQCLNYPMKKMPMFKIGYLSSNNLLSEWGFCVYIDILLRLGPTPKFRALKKMNAVMLRFSVQFWIENDLINWPFKWKIVTALVFHQCVFLPCDLSAWILRTVTHDSYCPLVTVIFLWYLCTRKACYLIHGK